MERIVTIKLSANEMYAVMSALDAQRNKAYDLQMKAERDGEDVLAYHYEDAANRLEAIRLKVFAAQETWAK
jgi:hypothetical protein